ncbi:UDP-N-Acetylglucosamine 2-epimerase [Salegentibacter agarivorans]|uniref:UDP-N-acetylglucosamine 2-epimerase (non-hydrolyzing) n=1 Tax=Salegentibacter agarivorans TaxID=345907 RepID=A0A1I2LB71_9FLAO|nr:UDP-N-acetylglucosamine 2-epimerase (non-hydrolyzing) [Salegentibacter agarivorans]SFF74336.1 UDP-N-Acetylglucosamine 2-epimerase [Salegentibacter agarivorans]
MKILLCFGTRPEAIKMVPIIKELQFRGLDYKVCVTAQHREMLDQVLDFFQIVPDFDLDLMTPKQSLNTLSAAVLNAIDPIFDNYLPDVVLVQGDTTSASIIALAAFHRSISVAHVEAGLRTYNKRSPFPEEGNRQIISKIADYHFTPTQNATENLKQEGVNDKSIICTGNTVVDALFWTQELLGRDLNFNEIKELRSHLDQTKKLILITGHRRESFGDGILNICKALLEISKREDVEIIYPLHLNPQIKEPVMNLLGGSSNIHLVPPVSYPAMIWLMEQCYMIISDSGGIQEEAPSFKKKVVVTREYTERIEAVEAGFCYLTGTNKNKIIDKVMSILDDPVVLSSIPNPYGDGKAATRIVEFLINLE